MTGAPKSISQIAGLTKVDCLDDPCVYFLVRCGRVVYVGQTVCLRSRLASHVDKHYDSVYFVRCKHDELDDLESHWITELLPELNVKLSNQKARSLRKSGIRFNTMLEAKRQLYDERGIGKNGPDAEQVIERMITILAKLIEENERKSVTEPT